MKTAVILSGQARSFAQALPNLAWQVFSKLENPHFFASIANDGDAQSIELLRERFPKAPVHIEIVDQPVLDEPPFSHAMHAPYAITPTRTLGIGPLQGILRQLWHLSRAWKFAAQAHQKAQDVHDPHGARNALTTGIDSFDVIVRCRPDIHFHRFKWPSVWPSGMHADRDALTPYWGNYGPGVNDRFAILSAAAAKAYFETYDNLPAMLADGIPFHPETLVGAAIERAGCHISRTLCAEFAFLRKPDPQHAGYWHEHMQVLPGELAEYSAHLSKQ